MRFRMNIYSHLKQNTNNDNTIININIKNNILLNSNKYDTIEINKRLNNSYFDKIIGINNWYK